MVGLDNPATPWPLPAGWKRPTWKSYALLTMPVGGGNYTLITTNQMRQIDQKIDDGKPYTGNTIAIAEYKYSNYSDVSAIAFNRADGCVVDPTSLTTDYSNSNVIGSSNNGMLNCDLIMRVSW